MGDKVEIEDMTTGGWTADALVNCITDIESGEQRKRHAAGQTDTVRQRNTETRRRTFITDLNETTEMQTLGWQLIH